MVFAMSHYKGSFLIPDVIVDFYIYKYFSVLDFLSATVRLKNVFCREKHAPQTIIGQYISVSTVDKVGTKYPKQITDIVECVMSLVTVSLLTM